MYVLALSDAVLVASMLVCVPFAQGLKYRSVLSCQLCDTAQVLSSNERRLDPQILYVLACRSAFAELMAVHLPGNSCVVGISSEVVLDAGRVPRPA